jgi:chromosome segregation ATPase
MPLSKEDLLQIRFIVKDEVSDIRVDIGRLNKNVDKLDNRLCLVETKLGSVEARLGKVETRIGSLETRVGSVEIRMGSVETNLVSLNTRVGSVESNLGALNTKVGTLESDSTSIMGLLRSQGERLARVEENTAVSRRILEKNELTEKSTHGRRLYRVESRIHKMGVAATTAK